MHALSRTYILSPHLEGDTIQVPKFLHFLPLHSCTKDLFILSLINDFAILFVWFYFSEAGPFHIALYSTQFHTSASSASWVLNWKFTSQRFPAISLLFPSLFLKHYPVHTQANQSTKEHTHTIYICPCNFFFKMFTFFWHLVSCPFEEPKNHLKPFLLQSSISSLLSIWPLRQNQHIMYFIMSEPI